MATKRILPADEPDDRSATIPIARRRPAVVDAVPAASRKQGGTASTDPVLRFAKLETAAPKPFGGLSTPRARALLSAAERAPARRFTQPSARGNPPVRHAARRAPTAALRWLNTVANLAGELPLQVIVDGRTRPSHSRYAWSGGRLVLTIATVLPELGLAFEPISTYTWNHDTDTIATHLTLGQGRAGEIDGCRHPRHELNPAELARACAYDHASRLIGDRHPVRVELDEHTFSELERVE